MESPPIIIKFSYVFINLRDIKVKENVILMTLKWRGLYFRGGGPWKFELSDMVPDRGLHPIVQRF
jgi:hypothetical protein